MSTPQPTIAERREAVRAALTSGRVIWSKGVLEPENLVALLDHIDAQDRRIAELVVALDRYGHHAENCNVNRLRSNEAHPCNCGLDAALAPTEGR